MLQANRLLVALTVCLGLIAACTGGAEQGVEEPAVPSTDPPATTAPGTGGTDAGDDGTAPGPPSRSDEEVDERLAALGGTLAVGNGPELSIVRPDGEGELLLDGSASVVAAQPTWSHDGSVLAWSSLSVDRQAVLTQEFGSDGLPSGPPDLADAPGTPVFYLQWSEADDRLAYLRSAPAGVGVEAGLVDPGSPVDPLAQGAPFFIAWSPLPDRLLAHVGDATIDAFDSGDPEQGFRTVAPSGGGFSAPAWVDPGRALIVADGALSLLDVDTGSLQVIEPVGATVGFVLSPDRNLVAYQVDGAGEGLAVVGTVGEGVDPVQRPEGGLIVLDLTTRERRVVTPEAALAWEWSPDGSRLAWLSVRFEQRPAGQWHFWSADGSQPTTGRTPEFVPTRKYAQVYLPFFAQYAQSVTGWAPDSSAFAFAGAVGGLQGIWVQLVDEVAEPHRAASGDFVTWGSGEPLPASGGGASAA